MQAECIWLQAGWIWLQVGWIWLQAEADRVGRGAAVRRQLRGSRLLGCAQAGEQRLGVKRPGRAAARQVGGGVWRVERA